MMELFDLMVQISRYCKLNAINPSKITVQELLDFIKTHENLF